MNHKRSLRDSLILDTFGALLFFFSISAWGLSAPLGASWQLKLQIPLPVPATALAYTLDGLHIATGSNTGEVTVRDAATGKLLTTFNTRGKGIESILFTPDGNKLISISQDNKAQIWNVTDWRLLGSLEGVTATADVSPDGKWLAAQDPAHNLWIWDLSTLKRGPQVGKTGTDGALALAFTPDGKSLALAYDYNPYLIDLQSKVATKLPIVAKADLAVKQIDKNTYVVNSGAIDDEHAFSHCVRASREGTLVAIGRGNFGQADFVDVYDWRAMKSIARIKPKDDGTVALFSSDNSLLAIQGKGQVTIWEIITGRKVATVKASGVASSSSIAKGSSLFQFSPVARELAVVDNNNLLIYQEK